MYSYVAICYNPAKYTAPRSDSPLFLCPEQCGLTGCGRGPAVVAGCSHVTPSGNAFPKRFATVPSAAIGSSKTTTHDHCPTLTQTSNGTPICHIQTSPSSNAFGTMCTPFTVIYFFYSRLAVDSSALIVAIWRAAFNGQSLAAGVLSTVPVQRCASSCGLSDTASAALGPVLQSMASLTRRCSNQLPGPNKQQT